MDRQVKSIPPEPKLSSKPKQLKPAKQPPKRKSELDDVVVDPEQLHLKRAINQIKREFRELELQEIIRKYSREPN